jgi:hypothetical protein
MIHPIKGKPVHAETVHINHPEASYGIFCFNDQGDLFLNCDYGMYGYAWRAYGSGPFRDFLAGISAEYMVNKLDSNYISTTRNTRGILKFSKEKLMLLCELFIKTLKENPAPVADYNAERTSLIEALKDCVERMNKCRSILQTTSGDHAGNWGILDTQKIDELLNTLK